MKKLKARLPCSACGKLGHWKDDPECPNYGKPIPPGNQKAKKGRKVHGVNMTEVYHECEVYLQDGDIPDGNAWVLVDTACAKRFAGENGWTTL